MITEGLIDMIIGVINFAFGMFPTMDFEFLSKITWLLNTVATFTNYAGYFLPVADAMLILTAIIVVHNFTFIWWLINWIIRRIADVIP